MRGNDLHKTMSEYLVERISAQDNIEVLAETEISLLEGEDGKLARVHWRHKSSGVETARPIRHVFLFCGAEPNTDWLKASGVAVDAKRFIRTGVDLSHDHPPLQTSLRGVFAIGDVRSGSVKRVAASVGEGAQVVAAIHAYLAELDRVG
jgi:thioredoxin reductase (NADPH)